MTPAFALTGKCIQRAQKANWMPGEVREDANCLGDTLTIQSACGEQYQFPKSWGTKFLHAVSRTACCDVRIGLAQGTREKVSGGELKPQMWGKPDSSMLEPQINYFFFNYYPQLGFLLGWDCICIYYSVIFVLFLSKNKQTTY